MRRFDVDMSMMGGHWTDIGWRMDLKPKYTVMVEGWNRGLAVAPNFGAGWTIIFDGETIADVNVETPRQLEKWLAANFKHELPPLQLELEV